MDEMWVYLSLSVAWFLLGWACGMTYAERQQAYAASIKILDEAQARLDAAVARAGRGLSPAEQAFDTQKGETEQGHKLEQKTR